MVSETVYNLTHKQLSFAYDFAGEQKVKGQDQPITGYRVRMPGRNEPSLSTELLDPWNSAENDGYKSSLPQTPVASVQDRLATPKPKRRRGTGGSCGSARPTGGGAGTSPCRGRCACRSA